MPDVALVSRSPRRGQNKPFEKQRIDLQTHPVVTPTDALRKQYCGARHANGLKAEAEAWLDPLWAPFLSVGPWGTPRQSQNKHPIGASSGTFLRKPSHPDIEALLMTPLTRSSRHTLTKTPHPPSTHPTCGLCSWANTPMKTPSCLFKTLFLGSLCSLSPPFSSVLNLADVPQSRTWF